MSGQQSDRDPMVSGLCTVASVSKITSIGNVSMRMGSPVKGLRPLSFPYSPQQLTVHFHRAMNAMEPGTDCAYWITRP